MDPAECLHGGRGLICFVVVVVAAGIGVSSSGSQFVQAGRESAHIVLSILCFGGQSFQVFDLPVGDEMLHDAEVVLRGVHSTSLCDRGVVVEEVGVLAIVHEVCGHGDLLLHHFLEREHRPARVQLEELPHDAAVRDLVPLLVGGDEAADLGQPMLAVLLGVTGGVAVGNKRRALLERGVDEAVVRVLVSSHILHIFHTTCRN